MHKERFSKLTIEHFEHCAKCSSDCQMSVQLFVEFRIPQDKARVDQNDNMQLCVTLKKHLQKSTKISALQSTRSDALA
jgi:hypothetical protein